jgi:Asp-tRNA(Asn)/Glu-tRNA(Gln) amidotransferase A subunit family amidase
VQAFVTLNEAGARGAADASSARWKAGRPLSAIDGTPIAIKDLLETKDMPTGPAPLWAGDVPGQPLAPRPTGDSVFNMPSSMLFAPCVSMPLMSVGQMPVGVQLMGQQHEDARITAFARWLIENTAPVLG